jgi:uncharacterized protein YidB (DUF937 family)
MKKLMIIAIAGILLVMSAFGSENRLSAGLEIPPADSIQAPQSADDCDFACIDWLEVAALTLGMDPDELWLTLMEEGQTLADIAKAHGVDPQTIIDAIFAIETEWIDEMVTSGILTSEEAEELKAETEKAIRSFVEEGFPECEDDDVPFKSVDWIAVAASTLGMDPDELWLTLLEEGQTLAEIAKARGVDPQTIIDAIFAAEIELIDKMVASGELTDEEADKLKTGLEEAIRSFVEKGSPELEDEELSFEDVEWVAVAASILGMEPDELWAALQEEGQTLAEIAKARGVDPQTIIDAIFAAETDVIDKMVANGELTDEEAEELKAGLKEAIRSFVEEGFPKCEDEELSFEDVEWIAVAALTLGMDPDELWAALLEEGQTLAEIAKARGVDPQTIIDAIFAAETDVIDEMVANGELTDEEAVKLKTELKEAIRSFVEEGFPEFEDDDFTFEDVEWIAVAALILEMEPDELWAALLEEGQTLAEIAKARGVDPQTIIDAILAAETGWIDEMVANGELTSEEAEVWKAKLEKAIRSFVEEGFPEFEDDDVPFEDIEWIAVAASTLEMDPDELWAALMEEGQTLAKIAKARGVDPQTIIDAILKAETSWIDEMVANGELTSEEAEVWKARLEKAIRSFVEKGFPECEDDDLSFEDVEWVAVAASTLGMDPDELWAALLEEDQTLAEIAKARGVDPQTIIDAIIAAETTLIDKMVASGEITNEEAEELKALLEEEVRGFVEGVNWMVIDGEADDIG